MSGVAVGQTRDDSKEFEYDHSYWSVDSRDTHFIGQEQVGMCAEYKFSTMNLVMEAIVTSPLGIHTHQRR